MTQRYAHLSNESLKNTVFRDYKDFMKRKKIQNLTPLSQEEQNAYFKTTS